MYLLLASHLGAALMLFAAGMVWWQIITGILLVSGSLWFWLSNLGYIEPVELFESMRLRIFEIYWDENDQWTLIGDNLSGVKRQYQVRLLPTTFVHAKLVVLNFSIPGKWFFFRNRSVVLMDDSTDKDTFRRLRVRLRWSSGLDEVEDN